MTSTKKWGSLRGRFRRWNADQDVLGGHSWVKYSFLFKWPPPPPPPPPRDHRWQPSGLNWFSWKMASQISITKLFVIALSKYGDTERNQRNHIIQLGYIYMYASIYTYIERGCEHQGHGWMVSGGKWLMTVKSRGKPRRKASNASGNCTTVIPSVGVFSPRLLHILVFTREREEKTKNAALKWVREKGGPTTGQVQILREKHSVCVEIKTECSRFLPSTLINHLGGMSFHQRNCYWDRDNTLTHPGVIHLVNPLTIP